MSFKAMAWASNQKLPAMQKIVLLMLASRADDKGACFPSHELIADDCGMDKRSAIRQVDKLELTGYLKVFRAKKGSHQVNNYILNIGFTSDRESPVQVTESHSVCDRESPVQVTESHSKQSMKLSIKQSIETTATRESEKHEIEKPAVAAKSKKNETSLPEFKKPTADEIAQIHAWADRFVNAEPLPTSPNDIVLTPEQLACYQWAMLDLNFWRGKINSKAGFIRLYEKKDSALKHQYETALLIQQAKKSPLEGNQAGFTSNQQNGVTPYANNNTANRRLSTAERQLAACQRAIEREGREQQHIN